MIISHKYRFIFIKTEKTAGTSIEVFLSGICADTDVLTPIFPPESSHVARNYRGLWNPVPEFIDSALHRKGRGIVSGAGHFLKGNKFYSHIPAVLVRSRVPHDLFDGYYKFCVDRNPWEKVLSHFHMLKARARQSGRELSMDEYFSNGCFPLNFPKYTDYCGNVIVNRIVRYENLNDELGGVFGQLGIAFDGKLGVSAKSEYRSDRRPYWEIFNNQQRRIVENVFAEEIRMHGYIYGAH